MKTAAVRISILIFTSMTLAGCGIGYNSVLFVTKSNMGIDLDTKPPTAEISIARREGVIAPEFEGGQTPPVISSFRSNVNPFSRFFFGVKSTFAGGDAAVALSQRPGERTEYDSAVCQTKKPDSKKVLWMDVSVPGKGEVRPFFFGTDTSLGLKVAWSGMTSEVPDTVRLGFNRKEIALAPVFGTDAVSCKIPGTNQAGTYAIWMPSFMAVLDNDVQAGTPGQMGVKWLQIFATGKSATMLAKQDEFRQTMMERIDPVTYTRGTYDAEDPTVPCIERWLASDTNHPAELQSWWEGQKLSGFSVFLIKTKEHKESRMKFIKEKKIDCK